MYFDDGLMLRLRSIQVEVFVQDRCYLQREEHSARGFCEMVLADFKYQVAEAGAERHARRYCENILAEFGN